MLRIAAIFPFVRLAALSYMKCVVDRIISIEK